jgi:hypothetical protein
MTELSTYDLRAVERALCDEDDLAELGIHLSVHGGRLFVRGDVAGEERRREVLDCVARHVRGLAPDDIVDELTVGADGLGHAPGHREEIS